MLVRLGPQKARTPTLFRSHERRQAASGDNSICRLKPTKVALRPRCTDRSGVAGIYVLVAARATTVTATAAAGPLAILRFVDFEGAAIEVGTIQRLHSARSIRVRHLHEAKTARSTRFAIGDQGDLFNGPMLGKQGTHGLISCRKGEIANV